MFENIKISKELSRLDLSFSVENIELKTYWCRTAIKEVKTFMDKSHAHSFFEIHLCIKGSAEFVFDKEHVLLKEGEFIFIPKRQIHQIVKISDDFVKLVWGFNAKSEIDKNERDYNKVLLIRNLSRYTVAPYNPNVLAVLSLLLQNVEEKKLGWFSVVKHLLYTLLVECARSIIEKNDWFVEETDGDHKVRMDAITPYILDNLSNSITVSELARQFVVSERQIARICYREYGMSAGEYIRSLQMIEAKRLLGQTDLSIVDVANQVGYADYYAFSKAFKRQEGMSPAKFRLSLLK